MSTIILQVIVVLALIGGAYFLSRRIRRQQKTANSTQDFMEISAIKNGTLQSGEQIVSLIEVGCVNYFLLSDEEQNLIEDLFASLMSSLAFPVQLLIQTKRLDVSESARHIAEAAAAADTSSAMRDYGYDLRDYLTSWGASRSTFTRRILIAIPAPVNNPQELSRRCTLVADGLRRIGLPARYLSTEEIASTIYIFYNKDNPARISDASTHNFFVPVVGNTVDRSRPSPVANTNAQPSSKYSLTNGTPAPHDLIAPDGVSVEFDYIRIGSRFMRVYAVTGVPSRVEVGFLDSLYSSGDIDVAIHVYPADLKDIVSELTRKITAWESQRIIEDRRGDIHNQGILRQAVEDAWELRDNIQTNRDRMFYVTVLFSVGATSLEALDTASRSLEESLAGRAIHSRRLVLRQDHALKSVVPIAQNRIPDIYRALNMGGISALFPFTTSDLSHAGGVLLGVNGLTGGPVFFDPFSSNNYNMAVLAASGAGKTFFMKMFSARSALMGVRTVLIDPEGEYEALTKRLGGVYIKFDPEGGCLINPFDIETDSETGFLGLRSKLLEMKSLFVSIAEMSGFEIKGADAAALEDAIRFLYEERGITEEPISLTERGPEGYVRKDLPTVSDLYAALRSPEFALEHVAAVLKPLVRGGTVDIFDGQSVADLADAPVICFDVSRLDEKFLRPVAMHICLAWVWEKFIKHGDKNIYKRVVVDEGWKFMKYEESANFLEEMARRARKRKAGLCIASQSFAEFSEKPQGRALLSNAETVVLMRQHPTVIDDVQEVFGLSDGQKNVLRQIPRGAALMRVGGESAVVHFEATERERVFLEAGSR